MKASGPEVAALVTAAQRGDRQALAELVAVHLPLVYNLVGRAVDDPADVDDVVQDTMVRAVRDLPALRTPASFRRWLTAIAVRQVGTHRHQRQATSARTAPLAATHGRPDPQALLEDLTAWQADLSAQRREVAEARRWLTPEDRVLLALWWQEVAGLMSRSEIAAALGLGVAHTGVRLQRMREQLDHARTVVAALRRRPGCRRLAALTSDWDDHPSPLWRKRISRHVRTCPICSAPAADRIPADRLLAAFSVLTVPAEMARTVLTETTAGPAALPVTAAAAAAKTTLSSLVATHPLVAAVVAGAAMAGTVVAPVGRPPDAGPRAPITAPALAAPAAATRAGTTPAGTPPTGIPPAGTPSPPPTGAVPTGPLSLEWLGGGYLAISAGDEAQVTAVTSAADRERATFVAVPGLVDPECYSLRTRDGRYLRHRDLRGYAHEAEDTHLFRQDATWCPRRGATPDSVMLQSNNYPSFYLRWTGTSLGLGYSDGGARFLAAGSFRVRPALAD